MTGDDEVVRSIDSQGESALDHLEEQARTAARELPQADLLAHDLETLVQAVLARWAPGHVACDVNAIWMDTTETAPSDGPAGATPPLTIRLHVPCSGFTDLLTAAQPRIWTEAGNVAGQGGSYGYELSLTFHLDDSSDATIEESLGRLRANWTSQIEATAEFVNLEVNSRRQGLAVELREILRHRQTRLRNVNQAAQNLDIRLSPTKNPVGVPVRPGALTLQQVEAALKSGAPEYKLADDIADAVLSTVLSFTRALERLPGTAGRLLDEYEEQAIRDLLLFLLNGNWQGLATGETFVGGGKSDILLRWRDRDAFIAELKIWDGPADFDKAINQLLHRYTVWRDTRVALIIFIRDRQDVTSIINKARATVLKHEAYVAGGAEAASDGLHEFSMRAQSDGSRIVRLTLLPVPVPVPYAKPPSR